MYPDLSYAFFGSGGFAARCLELLAEWRSPSWIVTSSPKPAGRGRGISRTPVGEARERDPRLRAAPLVETQRASSDERVLELRNNLSVDLTFVVDFGQFITEPFLSGGQVGCLNIHPSMLPLYRGAAPVQRALMDGAAETGVTIFKLCREMDAGPILLREGFAIEPDDDRGSLLDRAASMGVGAFLRYASRPLREWEFTPQDDSRATFAPRISHDEERIDWKKPASGIAGLIRALSPKPGAWTTLRGKRVIVLKARIATDFESGGMSGELLPNRTEPLVSAGGGVIALETVQSEGKKPQPAALWKNGLRAAPGECFI
jgi:methionyl-tRNA formyltransferase